MQAVITPDVIWAATKYEAIWIWQHKEMFVSGAIGVRYLIRHLKRVIPGIVHDAVVGVLAQLEPRFKAHEAMDDQRFLQAKAENDLGFRQLTESLDKIAAIIVPHTSSGD